MEITGVTFGDQSGGFKRHGSGAGAPYFEDQAGPGPSTGTVVGTVHELLQLLVRRFDVLGRRLIVETILLDVVPSLIHVGLVYQGVDIAAIHGLLWITEELEKLPDLLQFRLRVTGELNHTSRRNGRVPNHYPQLSGNGVHVATVPRSHHGVSGVARTFDHIEQRVRSYRNGRRLPQVGCYELVATTVERLVQEGHQGAVPVLWRAGAVLADLGGSQGRGVAAEGVGTGQKNRNDVVSVDEHCLFVLFEVVRLVSLLYLSDFCEHH